MIKKLNICTLMIFLATPLESLFGNNSRPPTELGRSIYMQNCISCHGEKGDGRGKAAAAISASQPKPRDFTTGEFKYGADIEEIQKTIRQGVTNTSMPPWSSFSDEELRALAVYVRSLAKPKK